ncbi:MAG: cell wall metabolism sensor histidine kinase WalK, partial [Eubacterium sp.]|nr:cell wall metabolism sensor histidine kinase WalK [Eubacterium sp.]
DNNKEKIQAIPKNFKINTRIVLTSVLAIAIPTVLIIALAITIFSVASSKINSPTISSASYNVVIQLKWNQIASETAKVLEKDTDKEKKLKETATICKGFENDGAIILITENNEEFYCSAAADISIDKMNSILSNKSNDNSYYLGKDGLIIIATAENENHAYRFVILNEKLSFPDFSDGRSESIIGTFINRTTLILTGIVFLFIIAIVVISFITTKTIVGPIRQITEGANEIAKGNFEHEIEYKSTNELGRLAESFNEMRLRVKASIEEQSLADKKQKEMIAGIAHDLRTPLTSVKGYLEGLRDGIADTPEKRNRYMDIIYSSTCDTEKMLDELLTISKLELGSITLNCEMVEIADFIGYAKQIGEELEKDDFDFEIIDKTKGSVVLNLDTDSFSRVINNIVSNSIKYRNKDIRGRIELTIIEYKNTVLFEIKDNGMGVDKESLPRIFDTLYRADKARSNVRNGSGLGLSICKQIVEMHGGLIWAQSELGNGLSIFISLPIADKQ